VKKLALNGEWKGLGISPTGENLEFIGTVPGCVHTDLWAEGKISDPYYRYNAEECQWIENWDWEYERTFVLEEISENSYLEFEGLDTYTDIYLNGEKIGRTDDMFLSYRFNVSGKLKMGINTLKVKFYSCIKMTEGKPTFYYAFTGERTNIRRMQCTFGWDWVQRFVTCGIWKAVQLCMPEKAQVESVYVYTRSLDDFGAQIGIDMELNVQGEGAYVNMKISDPNGLVIFKKHRLAVENTMLENVDIAKPKLWWPSGYGEQPLYTLNIEIIDGEKQLDCRELKFGIRTVRILQLPDIENSEYYKLSQKIKQHPPLLAGGDRNEDFSGFIVLINGKPIMVKGANWVPQEPFPSLQCKEKTDFLIELAKEGNLNMLRVWGGGMFEHEDFYNACDRYGILVSQDFLMACAKYPEENPWFMERLGQEAACAVKRLRNHTSLIWWTGDNENAAEGNENMQDYPGRKAALLAIGPVVKLLDPWRVFIPSSPFGGVPNKSSTKGITHNSFYSGDFLSYAKNTELLNYLDYFQGFLARFVAEAPVVGAPSIVSLRKFMTHEDIYGDNDAIWRYHTKNNPAPEFKTFELYDALKALGEKLFGSFRNGHDRLFKLQYVEYEWVRITLEVFRRNKWYSSGLLFWMYNDCWPASGWSIVDYYGLPKAGFYGFKRAAKSVIASIEKKEGKYNVFVCNDTFQAISGKASLYIQPFCEAAALVKFECDFQVEENTSLSVMSIEEAQIDKIINEKSILLCDIAGNFGEDRAFFLAKRPQDMQLPKANVKIIQKDNSSMTVETDVYVHAVGLEGDYLFDDNYFILTPNEKKAVHYKKGYQSKGGDIDITWLGK